MTKFDADLYFNDKLNEFFNTYTNEIIPRLENSRDKTFSLEKIRDEIRKKEVELYNFNYQESFLPDSYKYHIVNMFAEIYKEVVNNPVTIFLNEELPLIKSEDEKDFLRYKGVKADPKYDYDYLKSSTPEEIVELIAKNFVLNQLWYQISDFLCDLYEEDQTNLQRILYNDLGGLDKNYFKSQIEPELPNFKEQLKNCFNIPKIKESKNKEPFILNVPFEKVNKYIKKLHGLLTEQLFIDADLDEFTKHFKSESFTKIKWKSSKIQLVYLIYELKLRNESIHEVTSEHFVDKNGNEFIQNFAVLRLQMKSKYVKIDKILNQLKNLTLT